MSYDDRPALAFSIKYLENGDATLTVAGPAPAIREAAAAVFPDLAAALNPPPPPADHVCAACGELFAPTGTGVTDRCPECVNNGWAPLQPG